MPKFKPHLVHTVDHPSRRRTKAPIRRTDMAATTSPAAATPGGGSAMAKDRSLDQLYSIMQSCEVSDSSRGVRVLALLLSHVHLSSVRGHAQRVGHSPLCQDLHGQLTSMHACPCRALAEQAGWWRGHRGHLRQHHKEGHTAHLLQPTI